MSGGWCPSARVQRPAVAYGTFYVSRRGRPGRRRHGCHVAAPSRAPSSRQRARSRQPRRCEPSIRNGHRATAPADTRCRGRPADTRCRGRRRRPFRTHPPFPTRAPFRAAAGAAGRARGQRGTCTRAYAHGRCRTGRSPTAAPNEGGHQRSSEVIRGRQRSSEVIRGHQRSSKVIRGRSPTAARWSGAHAATRCSR